MNSKVGLCAPGTQEEKQTVLSSTASQPEELWCVEQLSLSCLSSVAKNLKNTKFLKSQNFQRACEFPVKPEPAVRVSMLEDLGLILYCFPPRQAPACCGWERARWSDVTLSSPPTAACSKSHAPETPPQLPVGSCYTRGSPGRWGTEGALDSRWDAGGWSSGN